MYREDDGQTGGLHHNSAAGGFGWQARVPKAFRPLQSDERFFSSYSDVDHFLGRIRGKNVQPRSANTGCVPV